MGGQEEGRAEFGANPLSSEARRFLVIALRVTSSDDHQAGFGLEKLLGKTVSNRCGGSDGIVGGGQISLKNRLLPRRTTLPVYPAPERFGEKRTGRHLCRARSIALNLSAGQNRTFLTAGGIPVSLPDVSGARLLQNIQPTRGLNGKQVRENSDSMPVLPPQR